MEKGQAFGDEGRIIPEEAYTQEELERYCTIFYIVGGVG